MIADDFLAIKTRLHEIQGLMPPGGFEVKANVTINAGDLLGGPVPEGFNPWEGSFHFDFSDIVSHDVVPVTNEMLFPTVREVDLTHLIPTDGVEQECWWAPNGINRPASEVGELKYEQTEYMRTLYEMQEKIDKCMVASLFEMNTTGYNEKWNAEQFIAQWKEQLEASFLRGIDPGV